MKCILIRVNTKVEDNENVIMNNERYNIDKSTENALIDIKDKELKKILMREDIETVNEIFVSIIFNLPIIVQI